MVFMQLRSKRELLITGGSGLLGSTLKKIDNEIIAPSKKELNILNPPMIDVVISRYRPKKIIHCAAVTQKTLKEVGRDECYAVNCMSTIWLSRFCALHGVKLFYISTDYVFDGTKEGGMYKEHEIPNPCNFYALTKLLGEISVLSLNHRVIRTSFCPDEWPYDNAFTDKYTSADYVVSIASLILKVVEHCEKWTGIINVGTARKSFYKLASKSKKVRASTRDEVKDKIPYDTSLDVSRMEIVLRS